MTARKKKAVKIFATRTRPHDRCFAGRIVNHRGVVPPRVRIGPHQAANSGDVLETGQEAPKIQTFAREHQVVGLPAQTIGRCETHRVTKALEHAPADGDLGRVEIPARDGNEDLRHLQSPVGSRTIGCGLAPALLLRHMKER